MVLCNYWFFQSCDSNIGLFSIDPCKVITLNIFCLIFATPLRAWKSDNNYCRNSWKSDNYMGSNAGKKPWTNLKNQYKKWSKEVMIQNFCYHDLTVWGAIEKIPILILQYWKLSTLKEYQKSFRNLEIPTIFSSN